MKIYESILKGVLDGRITSEYCHSNQIIGNHYKFDCSGFIAKCLYQGSYKRTLVEIRKIAKNQNFIKQNRFYCQDFDNLIKVAPMYWDFLPQDDPKLKIGDIIVVVFQNKDGHCMFVDEILEKNGNNIKLRVCDSTRFPHENDSRQNGQAGIGIGEIVIEYNNDQMWYDAKNPQKEKRLAEIYFVRALK